MTNGESTVNIWQQSFDIIDEIVIGPQDNPGTHLRLVETHNTKKRYIQCWSSLSNQWNSMYRYNVEENWLSWKKTHASIYSEGSKKRRSLGSDVQLRGTPNNSGRTTRRRTSTKSTEHNRESDGE